MIKSIAHVSFLVEDVQRSLDFYCGILQIKLNTNRPKFPFEGAWLDLNSQGQQLHLMQLPNPDSMEGRPPHGGKDRHIALVVDNIDELAASLEKAGVVLSKSKSGRPAFFCRDPDGNALEFAENFVPVNPE